MTRHSGPHAAIRDHHGSPAVVIDGEVIPPMCYCGEPARPGYAAGLAASGIRVFFVTDPSRWLRLDDFANLRDQCRALLDAAPGAWLILRVNLYPSDDWLRAHPDSITRFQDGVLAKTDWELPTEYLFSYASDEWRAHQTAVLERFLDRVADEPFADRVAGFFLASGGTGEWYYPEWYGAQATQHGRYADCSPAFRREFTRLLTEQYGDDDALRRAWRDPAASLDAPPIPDLDARAFTTADERLLWRTLVGESPSLPETAAQIGAFLNPDTHQAVADYYRARNLGTADSIVHFARAIKVRTGGTKLVGAFYGAWGCTHFQENGTVSGVRRILDDGAVDFLASPPVYENRYPGGLAAGREMQDSFRLRGRLFVSEEDTRTCRADQVNRDFTGTHTLEDTLTNLRRDFARNLCEETQAWWFDMQFPGGGWYDDPAMLALFARQQAVSRYAMTLDRSWRPEIAFIFDEDATWYAGNRTHLDLSHFLRLHEMYRIGAPAAYHFHDDVALASMPTYKLLVFVNQFTATASERAALHGYLARTGATAVWLYAPGLIDPAASERFSVEHVAALTGIRVALHREPLSPACRLTEDTAGWLPGVDMTREYGLFDRDVFGDVANMQPPGPTWTSWLWPALAADDPAATVLARYAATGQPAMAARQLDGWRSVFCGFKAIRADLLRALARSAGCHLYADADDILYANANFLAVHASTDGEKTIRFPRPCAPFEVYEEAVYGTDVAELRLTMRLGETKTFSLHGAW